MSNPLLPDLDGQHHDVPADDALAALAHFYRAFNGRDLDAMTANWLPTEQASMSNPLGGIARGWSEIRAVYRRLFLGAARVHVVFHDYTLHRFGDAFLAVGRERGTLSADETRLELAIRTSRLYRRTDDGWKQFHHHGSFEDAALLAAYREAVR